MNYRVELELGAEPPPQTSCSNSFFLFLFCCDPQALGQELCCRCSRACVLCSYHQLGIFFFFCYSLLSVARRCFYDEGLFLLLIVIFAWWLFSKVYFYCPRAFCLYRSTLCAYLVPVENSSSTKSSNGISIVRKFTSSWWPSSWLTSAVTAGGGGEWRGRHKDLNTTLRVVPW